eukprot:SAG22_NODE_1362_length_4618_cov_3.277495_2_plen_79_part_00
MPRAVSEHPADRGGGGGGGGGAVHICELSTDTRQFYEIEVDNALDYDDDGNATMTGQLEVEYVLHRTPPRWEHAPTAW